MNKKNAELTFPNCQKNELIFINEIIFWTVDVYCWFEKEERYLCLTNRNLTR